MTDIAVTTDSPKIAEIAADRERRMRQARQLWREALPADDTLVGQQGDDTINGMRVIVSYIDHF